MRPRSLKILVVSVAIGSFCGGGAVLAKEKEYAWGSISVDVGPATAKPDFGIGGGDTEAEAVENSQKFCKETGAKMCKSVVTYPSCGAFASNGQTAGWGRDATKAGAERGAMHSCEKADCVIVVSDCN